ncbi:hypothetical protein WICPIJ_008169 [Wickerhamomyces pijperi]|uniref:Uncharacterized protein n=1 Tax=Wickerhamomyces pijperi TaxID=599730 RepID=A0A9P8TJ37_WICPI|nr:hypothetical protein WICPIJ_008169 [Wickerhamomyces pijperi]
MTGLASKWSTDATSQSKAAAEDEIARKKKELKELLRQKAINKANNISQKGQPLASKWAATTESSEERENVKAPAEETKKVPRLVQNSLNTAQNQTRTRQPKISAETSIQFAISTNALEEQHQRSDRERRDKTERERKLTEARRLEEEARRLKEEAEKESEEESEEGEESKELIEREIEYEREPPTAAGNILAARLGFSSACTPARTENVSRSRTASPEKKLNSNSLFGRIGALDKKQRDENKRIVQNINDQIREREDSEEADQVPEIRESRQQRQHNHTQSHREQTRPRGFSDHHNSDRVKTDSEFHKIVHNTTPNRSFLSRTDSSPLSNPVDKKRLAQIMNSRSEQEAAKREKEEIRKRREESRKEQEKQEVATKRAAEEEEMVRLRAEAEKNLEELMNKKWDWSEDL